MLSIRKWAAFATKIPLWVFTLLLIRIIIGWRLCPKNKAVVALSRSEYFLMHL